MKVKFNKEQLEAIQTGEGIYGVSASSGAGKSTLMVERCRRLVQEQEVDPNKILITTFTNASAKDLKKKLIKVGCEDVVTGTFHSVCQRILGYYGINTFDNSLAEYKITNEFRKIVEKPKTKDIMSWIQYQKNFGIKPSDEFIYKECGVYEEYELRQLFKCYEDLKNRNKTLDFEDWLIIGIEMLKKKTDDYFPFKFDYIMVDEYQDSNKLQLDLIKLLCPTNNIFMIFDEKQMLYNFRGSCSDYCLHIEKYFPTIKRIHVSTNYRSAKNIVEYSNNFARLYYSKYGCYKDAIPFNKEDGEINRLNFIDKEQEANTVANEIKKLLNKGIKPNEIAVLYRNNKDIFSLENELKVNNISYYLTNTSNNFFNRKEIKFILSMLRLIENQNDDDAFETAFNSRLDCNLKFFKKDVLSEIIDISARKGISLFESSDLVRFDKSWQLKNINSFRDNIHSLQAKYKNGADLLSLINSIIKLSKINESIQENEMSEELIDEKLQSIEDLKLFVRSNTLESFLKFVYTSTKSKKKLDKDSIVLSTFHGSKGLEWDNVFIIGLTEKFPNMSKCEDILNEVNCFYVATTRAKKNMWISEIGYNRFSDEYFSNK
ncbi:ATP-dependent helicase [Clostridium sp. M14]|uniref:ATP-dependent helicase n=1 Tax=Clostridium sp. M14 TaxID=2716311 RepID=UPI0013EE63BF|nr:ATP-dependent helicase [Clostridium sp. M14]MBZ9693403.1 ATP-dependent helicase [Clostridium sp. M14]